MAIWVKPNGIEIEINDREETIEKAQELGWSLKADAKPKAKPKASKKAASKSVKKK